MTARLHPAEPPDSLRRDGGVVGASRGRLRLPSSGPPSRLPGGPATGAGAVPVAVGPVLLAPLRSEAAALRLGARGCRIERIGMGPARAEVARTRLARSLRRGAPVGLLGFGGGLDASDRPGDLVVATELRAADGSRAPVCLDESLVHELARALGGSVGRVRTGPVVSTTTLVSAEDRAELARSGALACEMESAWLAPLASDRPFVVVRALVDLPGRELASLQTVTGGLAAWRRLATASRIVADVLGRSNTGGSGT